MSKLEKPEFSRNELYTLRRALAVNSLALRRELKRVKRANDRGKPTRVGLAPIAMECADVDQLFNRLDEYLKAVEQTEKNEKNEKKEK